MKTTFFHKNPDQLSFWQKIEAFGFDAPGTEFTFQEKLARNNAWTHAYAGAVINEYKKFIFLCSISPTGASPSKAVDEAWHLHLTYTQSYWNDLCNNILGFDLHHYPSKGGKQEDVKHVNWYAETLVFYKKVFGSAPPKDIWPAVLNPEVLLVPDLFPVKQQYILAGGLAAIIVVFTNVIQHQPTPFHLTGKEFLSFFTFIAIISGVIFLVVGEINRHKLSNFVLLHLPAKVSLFDLGSYNRSKARAVQTAVLDLTERKVLEANSKRTFTVHKAHLSAAVDNPFYESLTQVEDGHQTNVREIMTSWFNDKKFIDTQVENLKQLVIKSYKPPTWILKGVLFIGAIRILQGLYTGYPISFLLMEWVVVAICILLLRRAYSARVIVNSIVSDHYAMQMQAEKDWAINPVKQYAVYGSTSLSTLTQAAILSGVMFSFSSFNEKQTDAAAGGCGGAGGCSGGGGGGGCGGGCGGCGGGCGGG